MAKADGLSEKGELCRSCRWPLMCCPGTIRRFVRCCPSCTHRTQIDVDYESQHKVKARPRRARRRA